MSAQYISLDSCITDYLDQSEQSNHKYVKCFNIAFRGMDDMGLDFFYSIRSVKLPVQANKTVVLPANYINYSKIGVLNDIGELIPLAYNEKLTTYADLWPNRLSVTKDNTLFDMFFFGSPIFYNWWNGNTFVNLYGLPSGSPFVGSFKVDNTNGLILLSEEFSYDYIILEYLSGAEVGGDYKIPIQFREAMIAWIGWQDISLIPSKTHVNNANVGMRSHDYYNKRRLAIAKYRPLHLEEAYDVLLKSQRICVKA